MHWTVKFDGEDPGPSDDFVFKFRSLESLNPEATAYALDKEYIESLIRKAQIYNHYAIFGNIKEVIAPDGTDHSEEAIYALVGFHKSDIPNEDVEVGVLLAEFVDGDFGVLGIWPDDAAEISKGDPERLEKMFHLLLESPHEWTHVMLILPIPDASPANGQNTINRL